MLLDSHTTLKKYLFVPATRRQAPVGYTEAGPRRFTWAFVTGGRPRQKADGMRQFDSQAGRKSRRVRRPRNNQRHPPQCEYILAFVAGGRPLAVKPGEGRPRASQTKRRQAPSKSSKSHSRQRKLDTPLPGRSFRCLAKPLATYSLILAASVLSVALCRPFLLFNKIFWRIERSLSAFRMRRLQKSILEKSGFFEVYGVFQSDPSNWTV